MNDDLVMGKREIMEDIRLLRSGGIYARGRYTIIGVVNMV